MDPASLSTAEMINRDTKNPHTSLSGSKTVDSLKNQGTFSRAKMVGEYGQVAYEIQETSANSSDDDIQIGKNHQLFLAIRKKHTETKIIQEIEDLLSDGANINAFNTACKTIVDIAHQKRYTNLERYLIGRGGKTAVAIKRGNNNYVQNFEVNIQETINTGDIERNRRNKHQMHSSANINVEAKVYVNKPYELNEVLEDGKITLTKDKLEKINSKLEKSELDIQEAIKALILCGIDINHQNPKTQECAIDIAWDNEYYDTMVMLLEAGSKFPNIFYDDLDAFYDDCTIPAKIKTIVNERQELHDWIRNNETEKIRQFLTVHEMSQFFNYKNVSALELAAECAHSNTLASIIGSISRSQEQSKLLLFKVENTEGNTLLSIAANSGNEDSVKFLIKCDIDINHRNKFEQSAIDLAWNNKHYDVVLILLQADSEFPNGFNLGALNETKAKGLKQFVEGRNKLHEWIEKNCLSQIKQSFTHVKSTLYLNSEGKSALVTALINRNFEAYAFLKSIGLSFKNADEKEHINNLPEVQKVALKKAMIPKFPQIDKGHILFLLSKSRSKSPVVNFKNRIEELYNDLDDIPEISIILQVVQYIDYLDVVFDFDNNDIKDMDPTASESTKGLTDYTLGRIYIAAGTDKKKLAGTLAHELAHIAVHTVYNNDCNPFDKVGTFRDRFENITRAIGEKLKITVDQMRNRHKSNGPREDDPEIILARAFANYSKPEQPSELIVRVPHILAQYSNDGKGRNILTTQKEYKLLLDYYNDCEEGGFRYRFKHVIENNFIIKPRKCIQICNETVGRINGIIQYDIHFEMCIDLDTFLNNDNQIFLIETENTFLSTLCVYDSLINRNYSLQDTILLEFNSYVAKHIEISKLLYSPAGKVLAISFSCNSRKDLLSQALNRIKDLLNQTLDKKVILIVQENETEILHSIKSTFNNKCGKPIQQKFTLNDFTKESQIKLLDQEITFQGKSITLNKLINISNGDEKAVIDTNTLVKLIKGERIEIARKPDSSDLHAAYSDLFQEIDIDTFVCKLIIGHSGEIYIISGISGANKKDSLVNYLFRKIENMNRTPNLIDLNSLIEVLDIQNCSRIITKRIQITGDQFKANHFMQICQSNSAVKIYWIHCRNGNDKSQFTLQRIYNPDFYVTGKRISRDVVIEKSVAKELISSNLSERFIISMYKKNNIIGWLKLTPEQQLLFQRNVQNNKISFVYLQKLSENNFPDSVEANQTVHLLKFKEDQLIWYKTYGSSNTLVKYRASGYKNIKPFIEESEAIKIIQENKVSIIAGDPGTGKSTIITRLYNTTFSEEETIKPHWVIKVNLKDNVETIKETVMMLCNNNISAIPEFLLQTNKNLNLDANQSLLKGLIGISLRKNCFPRPLMIIFDGFDEVLDGVNRNTIITLLRYLKDKTYAKCCVTTRRHYVRELEDALSTFALMLEPMDESTIQQFVTKFFSNRLSLKFSEDQFTQCFDNDGEGIVKYTDAFLNKMKEVFKNDINNFIGTPLQLFLTLENAVDSFVEWVKNTSKNPDFSYLGNDIWELYEKFVNKKYFYYCNTKTRDKDNEVNQEFIKSLDKYYRDIGKSMILGLGVKDSFKNIQNIVLQPGIVRPEGNHFGFIHPTFAEYFAAKAFMCWIRKWEDGGFTNFTKQKYFFARILQEPKYEVVRSFLNAKLMQMNEITVKLNIDYYDKYIVHRAAQENHIGIVKFVFDIFPNMDIYVNRYGCKVLKRRGHLELGLIIAADYGHFEMAKLLIDKGASINIHDVNGITALHAASGYGCFDRNSSLKQGVTLEQIKNFFGYENCVPLRKTLGPLKIAELLIASGADVNTVDKWGETPLMAAAQSGQLEIVKLLIDKGANVNEVTEEGRTALHEAARNGHLEIATLLVDGGLDIDAVDCHGMTALILAVGPTLKHFEMVKWLVRKGANTRAVDNGGLTALHYACDYGTLEIVNFFVDNSASIDNLNNKVEKMRVFLPQGIDNFEIVKYLLEQNQNMEFIGIDDKKLLHLAAERGYIEIVEMLIKRGADVNVIDRHGQTALHLSVRPGFTDIVKLLIENGADVNIVTKDGKTALFVAVECEHMDIVELLVNKGASIDSKSQVDL